MSNIKSLDTQPDATLAALEQMRRSLPALLENVIMVAQIKRTYYESLIKQGFTETQALEIVTKPMVL